MSSRAPYYPHADFGAKDSLDDSDHYRDHAPRQRRDGSACPAHSVPRPSDETPCSAAFHDSSTAGGSERPTGTYRPMTRMPRDLATPNAAAEWQNCHYGSLARVGRRRGHAARMEGQPPDFVEDFLQWGRQDGGGVMCEVCASIFGYAWIKGYRDADRSISETT